MGAVLRDSLYVVLRNDRKVFLILIEFLGFCQSALQIHIFGDFGDSVFHQQQ